MTDREALRILSIPNSYRNFNSQVEVAKLIAFNALKERVERSKGCAWCTGEVEYIEREALIEELKRRDFLPVIVKQAIEAVPAADVAPVVRGEWIERAWRPTCSLCGFSGSLIDAPISPFKYCPNCGAKMDGED